MPFDPVTYKSPVIDNDGEILMRAAEIIERQGLCKTGGWYAGDEGPRCVIWAIVEASRGAPQLYGTGTIEEFRKAGALIGFNNWIRATEWSDKVATQTEVIARLRSAAEGKL